LATTRLLNFQVSLGDGFSNQRPGWDLDALVRRQNRDMMPIHCLFSPFVNHAQEWINVGFFGTLVTGLGNAEIGCP
jgi:hypothetical protein